MNSSSPTQEYTELVTLYGDSSTENDASEFVDKYISSHQIHFDELVGDLQMRWSAIEHEYHIRAEKIFGVALPSDVTAYITINSRCPYSINENMFFVSAKYPPAVNKTVMHELWHFYTWYKFGITEEKRLGAEKYNEIKEALTVLLNVECADLMPEGVTDRGYPQHQELRSKILSLWSEHKNIEVLWSALAA